MSTKGRECKSLIWEIKSPAEINIEKRKVDKLPGVSAGPREAAVCKDRVWGGSNAECGCEAVH